MKKTAYLTLVIIIFLFTSCTVAVQKDRGLRGNGVNITAYENGRAIEILNVEQGRSISGDILRVSMPFFRMNAGADEWTGERYLELNIFK